MNTVQSSYPTTWSELPGDLLALIIKKLIPICSLSDYVRFGAVCRSWLFFFSTENYEHIKLSSRLPILLIPSPLLPTDEGDKNNNNNNKRKWEEQQEEVICSICQKDYYNPNHAGNNMHKSTRSFYGLSNKKVYNFQLPVPYYKKCCGSSHGWLVTVDLYNKEDHDHSAKLLNPFRSFNNEIQLPPLTTCKDTEEMFPSFFMIKAVLSANPWPSSSIKPAEDIVVMGIFGYRRRLGYCRPGDKVWTSLPFNWGGFDDVIYYKGQFYATKTTGHVVAFDVGHHLQEPKVTEIAQRAKQNKGEHLYLVECFGDLLQVYRSYHKEETCTRFEVYKLGNISPESRGYHTWVSIRDLNGCSLFLGGNASMSVNAADFPGCKPDCIYFTGGYQPQDMGVFCLLDQSIEPHYLASNIIMPAPIWIQPTL